MRFIKVDQNINYWIVLFNLLVAMVVDELLGCLFVWSYLNAEARSISNGNQAIQYRIQSKENIVKFICQAEYKTAVEAVDKRNFIITLLLALFTYATLQELPWTQT